MLRRRTFLQASAATTALCAIDSLPWLHLLRPVTAAEVNVVWDPPWNPVVHASDEAKDALGIW